MVSVLSEFSGGAMRSKHWGGRGARWTRARPLGFELVLQHTGVWT